jgi:hypothetical protein
MNAKAIRYAIFAGMVLASQAFSQPVTQEMIRVAPPESGAVMTTFRVMSLGGIEGKAVTGAPYSAEETTQTTQTLADGNRIVNTSKSKVYRDQQGRKRVEETLGNIGGLSAAQPRTVVMIDDPVANVHYSLHPDTLTAEKVETSGSMAKQQAELAQLAHTKMMQAGSGSGVGVGAGIGHEINQEVTTVVKRQIETATQAIQSGKMRTEADFTTAGPNVAFTRMAPANMQREEQDLGTQNMEGVLVQGKRTTTTIPAGAIGNERPIQIVDERWYSSELQMNVMTKHSDPRMGETVFTVTGMSRANPDATLFQLPSEYQITNSRNMVYKFDQRTTPE